MQPTRDGNHRTHSLEESASPGKAGEGLGERRVPRRLLLPPAPCQDHEKRKVVAAARLGFSPYIYVSAELVCQTPPTVSLLIEGRSARPIWVISIHTSPVHSLGARKEEQSSEKSYFTPS